MLIHSEVPMPTLYHTKRLRVISSINICFVVMFIAINVVDLTWLGSSLHTIEANVLTILTAVTAGFLAAVRTSRHLAPQIRSCTNVTIVHLEIQAKDKRAYLHIN